MDFVLDLYMLVQKCQADGVSFKQLYCILKTENPNYILLTTYIVSYTSFFVFKDASKKETKNRHVVLF